MRNRQQYPLHIIACYALIMAGVFCFASSPALALDQDPFFVYRIGGDQSFPPFEYLTESGSYEGFNVDLMHAIGIELGIQIQLVPMLWEQNRKALNEGSICAIQGMKHTPERDGEYLFSDAYLTSSLAIFVKSSEFGITSLSDLSGRTVTVQQGDAAHERVSRIKGATVVPMPNQADALSQLVSGTADAYVGNRLSGTHMAQKGGIAHGIKITGDDIDPMPYAMAFRKSDGELVELFNRGLGAVKASGAYNKIHAKWFGAPLEAAGRIDRRLLRFAHSFGIFITIAVILISAWNVSLRKLVALRTKEIAGVSALVRQIIDSSYDGVAALDSDLTFIWANKTAEHLMGWSGASLVGVNISATSLAPLASRTTLKAIATQGAQGTKCDVDVDVNHEPRILSVSLTPLMPSAGTSGLRGALLVFSDVTALRRVEQIESTSSIMNALARSVAGIAAEIGNPLMSISTYLGELPTRHNEPEFIEEICRLVPSQIARVRAAISDLLVFARPESPERCVFDLAESVSEAIGRIEADADSRGILIRHDIRQIPVFADRSQISDAIYRAIANSVLASKFMSGVEVRVEQISEDWAEVEVCDRVPGAAPGQPDSAIEPFFRLGPGNSGLGMAVSYKLIQHNGGLVTATCTSNGTCVKMRIPRTQKASSQSARIM